jgi:hypothetical protein
VQQSLQLPTPRGELAEQLICFRNRRQLAATEFLGGKIGEQPRFWP